MKIKNILLSIATVAISGLLVASPISAAKRNPTSIEESDFKKIKYSASVPVYELKETHCNKKYYEDLYFRHVDIKIKDKDVSVYYRLSDGSWYNFRPSKDGIVHFSNNAAKEYFFYKNGKRSKIYRKNLTYQKLRMNYFKKLTAKVTAGCKNDYEKVSAILKHTVSYPFVHHKQDIRGNRCAWQSVLDYDLVAENEAAAYFAKMCSLAGLKAKCLDQVHNHLEQNYGVVTLEGVDYKFDFGFDDETNKQTFGFYSKGHYPFGHIYLGEKLNMLDGYWLEIFDNNNMVTVTDTNNKWMRALIVNKERKCFFLPDDDDTVFRPLKDLPENYKELLFKANFLTEEDLVYEEMDDSCVIDDGDNDPYTVTFVF